MFKEEKCPAEALEIIEMLLARLKGEGLDLHIHMGAACGSSCSNFRKPRPHNCIACGYTNSPSNARCTQCNYLFMEGE